MRRLLVVSVLLAMALACERKPELRPLSETPVELKAAVGKGNAGIDELAKTLKERLLSELKKSPEGAVNVCADEAKHLTQKSAEKHGITLGRSSTKLRNASNAPKPWVASWLKSHEGKPALAKPAFIDLGDRVGVLRPIIAGAVCLTCHGSKDELTPEVKAALAKRYPNDHATGYAMGDLRGVFWAEVKKDSVAE